MGLPRRQDGAEELFEAKHTSISAAHGSEDQASFKMQEREEALAERGHLRALEVNLAIERHEQLHSL